MIFCRILFSLLFKACLPFVYVPFLLATYTYVNFVTPVESKDTYHLLFKSTILNQFYPCALLSPYFV
jgi:hypothetical protein